MVHLSPLEKAKLQLGTNAERAEQYADAVSHNIVYFSSKPSLLRWIHEKRFRSIKSLMGNSEDKIILDAGSGEGYFLSQINAKEKYGIEISTKRIERAKSISSNQNFIRGDVKKLPFQPGKFDIIICSEVLEHVDNYKDAIQEFKRCLRPSGKLILSFPNEKMVRLARALIFRFPIHEPDHINNITLSDVKHYIAKKFIEKNVPKIPYPLCLYQVYCIAASDLL